MRIEADAWLSEMFGHPVYRVDPKAGGDDALRGHVDGRVGRSTYYAKVDTRDIDTVRTLARAGMYVVDTGVTLRVRPEEARAEADVPGIHVDDCTPADSSAVLDIAGSAFRYSRFHLDPEVPPALAHRIKREWILNYVRKRRGEALLVAKRAGQPVGFLAVIGSSHGEGRMRVIDLIAVDANARRCGVGRALVSSFVQRFRGVSDLLQVGTQVANAPSLALYQQFGFTVADSSYAMHLHAGPRSSSE